MKRKNMKVSKQKNKKVNSLIIAIYLAETLVCGIINSIIKIPNISVFLMFALIVLTIIFNRKYSKKIINFLFVAFGIIFILIVSGILNGWGAVLNYLIYFFVFGITSLLLISIDADYERVMYILGIVYTIYLLFYFVKIRGSFLTSATYWVDQMGTAYSFLPIIILSMSIMLYPNSYINKTWKKMWILLLGVVSVGILIVDCATRGAIVAIIISFIVLYVSKLSDRKKILIVFAVGILATYVVYNYVDILISIDGILRMYNVEIPTIEKMIFMINAGNSDNGRALLYSSAKEYFKASPVLGHGVGYFENIHNGYVHNFFLEILCEYGILGFLAAIIFFLRNVTWFVMGEKNIYKVFSMLLFCSAMPLLFFSSSYWLLPQYWFYFFWILACNHYMTLKART